MNKQILEENWQEKGTLVFIDGPVSLRFLFEGIKLYNGTITPYYQASTTLLVESLNNIKEVEYMMIGNFKTET